MIPVCKIQVRKKFRKVQYIFSETSDISLNFGIGHKLPPVLSKYTPSPPPRIIFAFDKIVHGNII